MLTSVARSSRYRGRAASTVDRRLSSSSVATVDVAPAEPFDAVIRGSLAAGPRWYPARTVRLIEVRLYDGPNVYRLEPVVKLEVAIGRRRTWYGRREPGAHALVHLGASVPRKAWSRSVVGIVDWVRRLHRDAGEPSTGVAV